MDLVRLPPSLFGCYIRRHAKAGPERIRFSFSVIFGGSGATTPHGNGNGRRLRSLLGLQEENFLVFLLPSESELLCML
jgi:hypothetical protein